MALANVKQTLLRRLSTGQLSTLAAGLKLPPAACGAKAVMAQEIAKMLLDEAAPKVSGEAPGWYFKVNGVGVEKGPFGSRDAAGKAAVREAKTMVPPRSLAAAFLAAPEATHSVPLSRAQARVEQAIQSSRARVQLNDWQLQRK